MINSTNLKINTDGELCYITFPSFEKTGILRHAFSTRLGGVSTGMYSTMNLSFSNGDNLSSVKENFMRICNTIGVDFRKCVVSKQTHTVNLRVVDESDVGKGVTRDRDYDDVDGLITNIPGVVLVTQFADCVPLLFCDPINKVIAASHAGWRGTVGKIGALTVQKMHDVFGSNPQDIIVGIAPSIMQCCFEVDEPVYKEFCNLETVNTEDICEHKDNNKYNIDLQKTNKIILENAGIKPENITVTDLCTKCHADVFHSHRATGGKRGNLAAFISLV
ncbi:MAG: peptidoglycan editing factor PgeF [Oscillospiraceae bacterium]|nr:peptidoglycan editing factor PgeF [Oscillospiraceae bacterium]